MTQSLETLRSSLITGIFGRRFGLTNDEYVAGAKDIKRVVTEYTSASTGTVVPAHGVASFQLTTLSTQDFLLSNPVPGVSVDIMTQMNGATNLSSNWNLKRPSTAFYIESSEGSTMTTINMSSRAFIRLTGVTTDRYQVTARTPGTTGSTGYGPMLNGTT